jgi:monoamine oxidase
MAKTALFTKLQRIVARLRAPGHADTRGVRLTRRELGALAASGSWAWLAGCSSQGAGAKSPDAVPSEKSPRVAVVGAGLAGAHCAYRLHQAGVDVTLYEGSARVGGRTFTGRSLFAQNQICELGGELIDTNHRFMFALAKELGLEFDDRFAGAYANAKPDTWFVGGKIVPEEQITQQFTQVVGAFAQALQAADNDDDEFARLDRTNLKAWLDQTVPVATYPELNAVLGAAYVGEFGLELEEQSCLNLVYLIGSDDPEPFRMFGESDERYHLRLGNDSIVTRLAESLAERVVIDHVLVRAVQDGGKLRLSFDAKGSKVEAEFDRLVFALPFTKLREVDLARLGLSGRKRQMIAELGYGTNAKVMGAFRTRLWLAQGANGSVTSDLPMQQVWDTSIGQDGEQGILTNFLGGKQGLAAGEGTEEAWFTGILSDLDRVFPGAAEQYLAGSAVRMHWPKHRFTLGSYACYRPGQWDFWGTEGLPEGNVHFCGEHTSPEFQGWMEGAAESGGRAAIEILDALGLPWPAALRGVVDDLVALPGQALGEWMFPKRAERIRASLATSALR